MTYIPSFVIILQIYYLTISGFHPSGPLVIYINLFLSLCVPVYLFLNILFIFPAEISINSSCKDVKGNSNKSEYRIVYYWPSCLLHGKICSYMNNHQVYFRWRTDIIYTFYVQGERLYSHYVDFLFLFLISRWYYYYILCQSHLLSWNNNLHDNMIYLFMIQWYSYIWSHVPDTLYE